MQFKEPKVIMLAQTGMNYAGLTQMLDELGAPEWGMDPGLSGGEALTEVAGRFCYKSFGTGLNPNVTKVREGNKEYISNILKQMHGSVLEHSYVTFAFLNVSRVFTHEIVRHRAGVAISQESLRYVRLTDLGAFQPEEFDAEDCDLMRECFEYAESLQRHLAQKYSMDDEPNFQRKKKLTSAFRRLAPIGLSTNIIVTANHRAWRHIIEMRTSPHAEEEIRLVIGDVADIMKNRFPYIYQDLVELEDGYEFKYKKV